MGKGNEKGSIESLGGFVERHFFTPVPEVKDYDELNEFLMRKSIEYLKYHSCTGFQNYGWRSLGGGAKAPSPLTTSGDSRRFKESLRMARAN